ncbi:lysophospholipase [Lentinus brumalis]|uniref:Lysophospholipase n=1 Tax=Lentinus brumalis TaxID=2498619 RepID=A0A371CUT2_9APHY|nr:lysophospholipase [Polyporus brumalis]
MTSPVFTEAWLDGADGHRFYSRTYPASPTPKAVLIFVHGFADHVGRYEQFHPRCARRGITVFAYDMRGFGRTALDEEHRSPDEAYGKTDRSVELRDLEWWVQHVRRTYSDVPIFVMGHSAGGGLTMAFATRPSPPPEQETLSMVSGIIAQAPLVGLTHPTPTVLRYIARVLSRVAPTMSIPAPMPEERFSRDPKAVEALVNDPLRIPRGTTRGLLDMVSQGAEMLEEGYKRWPKDLPLLMTWGTVDEVNCPKSGVAFFNKLDLKDKKLVEYEGAYHDLLHEVDDIPDKVTEEYIAWIESHLSTGMAS